MCQAMATSETGTSLTLPRLFCLRQTTQIFLDRRVLAGGYLTVRCTSGRLALALPINLRRIQSSGVAMASIGSRWGRMVLRPFP